MARQGHAVIGRDPFGRFDHIRKVAERYERKGCEWCGNPDAKYQYGTRCDGIYDRPFFSSKVFCSVGCYRSYVG